jgi:hypothetical protein
MHSFFLVLTVCFLALALWNTYQAVALRGEEAEVWLAFTKLNWDGFQVTLVVWFFYWLITLVT